MQKTIAIETAVTDTTVKVLRFCKYRKTRKNASFLGFATECFSRRGCSLRDSRKGQKRWYSKIHTVDHDQNLPFMPLQILQIHSTNGQSYFTNVAADFVTQRKGSASQTSLRPHPDRSRYQVPICLNTCLRCRSEFANMPSQQRL